MGLGRGAVCLLAGAAFAACGCGVRPQSLLQPNQPPEVELFAQRLGGSDSAPAAVRFSWSAHDPDGRVEYYLYSIGSIAEDDAHRAWVRTTDHERVLDAGPVVASPDSGARKGAEPRIFTLQAVDGHGARSNSVQRALFEFNLAPWVWITAPTLPPQGFSMQVAPTLCIAWDGADEDGRFTKRPVKYKYKLLTANTEVTLSQALADPDTIRRYYAPRWWAGWDSAGAAVDRVTYTNLPLNQDYLFVITCFDELGEYDPVFTLSRNMFHMRPGFNTSQLPRLTISNEYFAYTYPSGRFDPAPAVIFEAPADRPITFNWWASVDLGESPVTAFRWALDIKDVADDTPRSDESYDLEHWSAWSLSATSATLPPLKPNGSGPEAHNLFVEAKQAIGCAGSGSFLTLGSVRFSVVRPTFSRQTLIVDDTRLRLDRVVLGTVCTDGQNRPVGIWPTQAELDTFLYAVGNKPWKCYPPVNGQPVLSSPGILAGYDFDTLGTNLRIADLHVPLSTLGGYQHVIWLTDAVGALNIKSGSDLGDIGGPQTAMRYMNSNGQANTLAAYISQGGLVWLAGGGAATASLINYNRRDNDVSGALAFSNSLGELIPGRFVYDQAHWRSEFKQFRIGGAHIFRSLGRFEGAPGIYLGLPAEMQAKTAATDPFPPNRTGSQGDFYQSIFDIEYISSSNRIFEDTDPGPGEVLESTLDTLYRAAASSLPQFQVNAVMTYYHGGDNSPLVLTGFNIWNYRRSQCVELADFVLQQLWGLTRNPVDRGAPALVPVSSTVPIGRLKPVAAGRDRAGRPPAARGR